MSESSGGAGWFPDPTGRYEHRYFNGTQWTADVAMGGQRFVDHALQPAAPAGWGPGGPSARRPSRAMAVASFIVGLVSLLVAWLPFLFALAAIGAVVGFIFGVMALGNARRHDGLGRGYAVSGIVLSIAAAALCVVGFMFTLTVVREVGDFLDPGHYHVEVACQTDGVPGEGAADQEASHLVTLTGSITNNDDETRGYTITVEYLVGGVREESDTIRVDDVAPGDTADFEASEFVTTAKAVQCQVAEVFGPVPFGRTGG